MQVIRSFYEVEEVHICLIILSCKIHIFSKHVSGISHPAQSLGALVLAVYITLKAEPPSSGKIKFVENGDWSNPDSGVILDNFIFA